MLFQINPSFTKKNQLKLDFNKNILDHNFKLCFSLVYSIKSIDGANIIKQIGRYYEIEIESNTVIMTLQTPRTGSYNMSSGPEGLFIIDKNNKRIECVVHPLIFENPISLVTYPELKEKISDPVIPMPFSTNLKQKFIKISNLEFKIRSEEKEFFKNIKNLFIPSKIKFNITKGFEIIFCKVKLQNDGYKIYFDKNLITINYSDYGGKLYSVITLIQLLNFYKSKLPLGSIEDKPSLIWRGMHLDCARQFYSVDEIKRLFDYMCFFKLNRFHWHLTDNEAWRVELKCYPDLTSKGAYRGYREKIPPFYGSGYKKTGGYYSRIDIKELIEYAKFRNIEIMPEIDLPAHSWTLLQIMPELKDPTSYVSKDIGNYQNNTINPILDETDIFLKNILKELSDIFSFNLIHVGVDERPKEAWKGSSKVIRYMKKNKISSFDELQDHYMNNIISILKKFNKLTAAWNEAALPAYSDIGSAGSSGNVDKSCIIFAWENQDVGLISTKKGYKTVLCPGHKTYFDMAHNNSTYERGICWASTIEVKEVFDWKPLKGYKPDELINIFGIQGQLWSETITNKDYFDEMINPRLAALAEIAWCTKAKRTWGQFRSSLVNQIEYLTKIGWKHHNF